MIWNIPTEDDDAQAAGKIVEYIDDKQKGALVDALAEKGIAITKFVAAFKIEELAKLPKTRYQEAVNTIAAAKKVIK
jgi:hypothetical protein